MTHSAPFSGCFSAVFNVGHLAPLWMAAETAKLECENVYGMSKMRTFRKRSREGITSERGRGNRGGSSKTVKKSETTVVSRGVWQVAPQWPDALTAPGNFHTTHV